MPHSFYNIGMINNTKFVSISGYTSALWSPKNREWNIFRLVPNAKEKHNSFFAVLYMEHRFWAKRLVCWPSSEQAELIEALQLDFSPAFYFRLVFGNAKARRFQFDFNALQRAYVSFALFRCWNRSIQFLENSDHVTHLTEKRVRLWLEILFLEIEKYSTLSSACFKSTLHTHVYWAAFGHEPASSWPL